MKTMKNLLEETLEALRRNNKQESDVRWVGTRSYKTTWEVFKKNANVKYDNGYGLAQVVESLLVVGENWWLEREEYDGTEWWVYKALPKEPAVSGETLHAFYAWSTFDV